MKTLVLGIGNPILSDDGAGIHVARALQSRFSHPEVTVTEASIAGLDMLDFLSGYDRVIIVDAIQTRAGKAGYIYRFTPDALVATQHTATPHDVNFATALALGQRLGITLPQRITIFAIEAADVTSFSEKCTPKVENAVSGCVEMIMQELAGYGITCMAKVAGVAEVKDASV